MTLRVLGLAFAALGAVAAGGCNMSMPGTSGRAQAALQPEPVRPAPLRAAPSGPVRRGELPPPAGTNPELAAQTPANAASVAAAPPPSSAEPLSAVAAAEAALANPSGETGAAGGPAPVEVAAVDAGDPIAAPAPVVPVAPVAAATAPATPATPAVGRGNFTGGWKVASGGDNCQLHTTLTSWSGGYRASTKGCSSPELKNVSAWTQNGNQVTLVDDAGQPVARLFPTNKTQYNGQTEGGGSISVSR